MQNDGSARRLHRRNSFGNNRHIVKNTHGAAEQKLGVGIVEDRRNGRYFRVAVCSNQVMEIEAEGRVTERARSAPAGYLLILEVPVLGHPVEEKVHAGIFLARVRILR